MRITVRASDHDAVIVEINPKDATRYLILALETAWDVDLDPQNYDLVYSGTRIPLDFTSLEDHGIDEGATVDLVRVRGRKEGHPISQVCLTAIDEDLAFDIWIWDGFTGRQLRRQVADELGLKVDEVRIFYLQDHMARPFEDLDALKPLKIRYGASILIKRLSKRPYFVNVELPDSSTVQALVADSWTISETKSLLADLSGLSSLENLSLVFKGKYLEDTGRLSDTLITSESKLKVAHVVKISFFDADLKRKTFRTEPSSLVVNVKRRIAEALLLPADDHSLFKDKELLEDHRTLESYKIVQDATLSLEQQLLKSVSLEGGDGLVVPLVELDFLRPIREVKEELAGKYFMVPKSPDHFDVVFNGQILQPERNLNSYQVAENDRIHIRHRPQEKKQSIQKVVQSHKGPVRQQSKGPYPKNLLSSKIPGEIIHPLLLSRPIHQQTHKLSPYHSSGKEEQFQDFKSDVLEIGDFKSSAQEDFYDSHVTIPEATPPMEQPTSSAQVLQNNPAHILGRYAEDLSQGKWKTIRAALPEPLKWDIEYDKDCWTYRPTEELPADEIPLTIAGAPVVVPVDWQYPLVAGVAPPPDPCPTPINPRDALGMETIVAIFEEYPDALGFYLLINGFLQIIVPEKFDYEWALSYQPNRFGGLKVSYIKQGIKGTAGHTHNQIPLPTNSRQENQIPLPTNSRQNQNGPNTRTTQAANLRVTEYPVRTLETQGLGSSGDPFWRNSTLTIGDSIEARRIRSRSGLKHKGRIGLNRSSEDKVKIRTQTQG